MLIQSRSMIKYDPLSVVALSEGVMSKLFDDVKNATDHEILVALGANKERAFPNRAVHPALVGFANISDDAEARLERDIKINGQQRAIVLHHGYVLDGRARYRCCIRLNITPKVTTVRLPDPMIWLVQRNDYERYGTPGSIERRKVVSDLSAYFGANSKRDYLDRRAQFIAHGRERFKNLHRYAYPESCVVCGLSRDYSHAHHSLPLSHQYDLGFEEADQTFDWVCGVHHTLLHRLVNREIVGRGRSVPFSDNHLPEMQAAQRVLGRALAVFSEAGGIPAKDRQRMLLP